MGNICGRKHIQVAQDVVSVSGIFITVSALWTYRQHPDKSRSDSRIGQQSQEKAGQVRRVGHGRRLYKHKWVINKSDRLLARKKDYDAGRYCSIWQASFDLWVLSLMAKVMELTEVEGGVLRTYAGEMSRFLANEICEMCSTYEPSILAC